MSGQGATHLPADDDVEQRIDALLDAMTLAEKIGQMHQANVGDGYIPDYVATHLRAGRIGSVLNLVDVDLVNELQRIAVEETRLGIPLLIARDVIHGFRTVMPIPFAQAASWDPAIAEDGARAAASEAAACGINWTFAPMIDVARDPRWGRIAESLGEDPYLASVLGAAMVRGFQGDDLTARDAIAACAKHFAGYGTAESGRDYATTNVPENEMRNVYLRPFRAAVDAGVATLMTSFGDIDGVPATANEHLLRDILRDEWGYDGTVVSDWDSIRQLCTHGLTEDDHGAALEAIRAGVDIEMHGDAYLAHLDSHLADGAIAVALIDAAVRNVLRLKFRLGLFERPYTNADDFPPSGDAAALAVARRAAEASVVLLRNQDATLPLSQQHVGALAVVGPLADAPRDQLGTWIFDGDPALSVTPLAALRAISDGVRSVHYAPGLPTSRSRDTAGFDAAVAAAEAADVTLVFLGEEAILSGEAHSRADIALPGAQRELVRRLRAVGKPLVAVIMTGRPLTLTDVIDDVDALLFAGHLGTMAGPAIVDLLFGHASPSGRLPATLPRMVGQIPIYYSQKNTGKPPSDDAAVLIDDIDANAEQLSTGMTAYHLDAGFRPLFPFGFGLTYSTFDYRDIRVSSETLRRDERITVSAELINTGGRTATEVVQLYLRDLVGSVTRPVRELKGFRRVTLEPGQQMTVQFEIGAEHLEYFGRNNRPSVDPGEFHVWIGGCSDTELRASFRLVGDTV